MELGREVQASEERSENGCDIQVSIRGSCIRAAVCLRLLSSRAIESALSARGSLIRLLTMAPCLVALLAAVPADAGVMTRESMLKAFPAPLIVGEKERDVPVWPIFQKGGSKDIGSMETSQSEVPEIVAYVFESIDLAPIPGFAGTPSNLLVALDVNGKFMDVKVLSQHEPMFMGGHDEGPLLGFVEQYKGLSLKQGIRIGANPNSNRETNSANAFIDGIAKGTVSAHMLNRSLLSASLKIARAKMGYAEGRDPDMIARIKPDVFEPMDWDALVKAGLIAKKTFRNRDIDQAFVGTAGEGVDAETTREPNDRFIDLYLAYLNVPAVGRNLLTPEDWQYLQRATNPGESILLAIGTRPYSFQTGDDIARGADPNRLGLSLYQQNLPLEILNPYFKVYPTLPAQLKGAEWRALRVMSPAGLDPAQALKVELLVTRSKSLFNFGRVSKVFPFGYQLPEKYFEAASSNNKGWRSIWSERIWEMAVLVAGLAVLGWALRNQIWLSNNKRRLAFFRTGYLLFTLCFIGWYAQGQLSIVNITALIQALVAGHNLNFFLHDPITVILWSFLIATFFLWGRGTFCGWLCPYGALQELLNKLVTPLRLRQIRISDRTDTLLRRFKYGVLAVIVSVACFSAPWTDRLTEVEPFKTSITLFFDRSWPFVLWAGGLMLLSVFLYKGYCRYLCPLGAVMVLLGRMRQFAWIERRTECGQPCQRCRKRCAYQGISKAGEIDYDECFQCLDCVAIGQSDQLCVPLIVKNRDANRQAFVPVVSA